MAEFAHQVGFREPLGCNREGGLTACWLPKEATLIGIEAKFEYMVAPGNAQIVIIATKIKPPIGAHAPEPATARQILKDAIQVEHLHFPFWAVRSTSVPSF